jgi:hypothetical protein
MLIAGVSGMGGNFMESTVNMQEIGKQRVNSAKWYANWKFITVSIIIIIALFIAAGSYYQANHFNSQIKINGVKVGRMTADQTLNKLKTTVLKNVVFADFALHEWLTGRENGKITYQVNVNYWAPFTNDGQGFPDASWRGNWASNAYLTAGSHGCLNTPPSIMKTVYNNLSTNEPVVIY